MNNPVETIKENLERRFKTLSENKKERNFSSLYVAYVYYLGSEEKIGKIIEYLVLESQIGKANFLKLLAHYYLACLNKKFSDPKIKADFDNGIMPYFYTKKIDGKLGLMQIFIEIRDKENDLIKTFPIIENDFYFISQLHNDVMEKLTASKNKLYFDAEKSILSFQGKEILISKGKNSDAHYLLKVIFTEKDKTWDYEEIEEIWGAGESTGYDEKARKKIYQAGKYVNRIILADFLETGKYIVNINKKYLLT